MEWGAAAFTATSVTATRATVFPSGASAASLSLPARRRPAPPPGATGAADPQADRLRALFAAWQAEHGVSYAGPAAEAAALPLFTAHVAALEDAMRRGRVVDVPHLDADGRPTRFNRFAATPRAEWEAAYRGHAAPAALPRAGPDAPSASPSPPAPPPSWDWRTKGVVTAVKDQGAWGGDTRGARGGNHHGRPCACVRACVQASAAAAGPSRRRAASSRRGRSSPATRSCRYPSSSSSAATTRPTTAATEAGPSERRGQR